MVTALFQDDGAYAGATPRARGPLAGLRVVEIGSIIAGPLACRMLADLGAEVIKVEAPGRPDPMREWGAGEHRGRKLWWPIIARNKKLVTIDLGDDEGRELFLSLIADVDAVVENFRPGTLERWRLSYVDLAEVNPAVVLVRVSGYGQTGPYASRPGLAAAAEALSGLRYLNGYPGEIPPRTGVSLGDSLASLFAVQGLLAALHRRTATGVGEVVDVSILESCLAITESAAAEYDVLGAVRGPGGARLAKNAPSNAYRTADGKLMVIAANHDVLFQRLCAAMGRHDLATDPAFATHAGRGEHEDRLDREIQAWAGERTAAEIDAALAGAGVVCSLVATIADVFEDPHIRARGALAEHDDPEIGRFRAPGVTPRFSGGDGAVRWTGKWQPGADNEEILGDGRGA
jgi:formyl-CoA transferase